jgi:hypothetical protein
MGQKLMKCYEFVGQQGGLQAQMRLAMKTGCPSAKAVNAPETPDLVAKFKAAVKEITGKDAPIV